MSKYVFYSHINSGNRGCEAIVRSSIPLLESDRRDIAIITEDIEVDRKCGLDDVSTLIPIRSVDGKNKIPYIPAYFLSRFGISPSASTVYKYKDAIDKTVSRDTVALSTGGDLYCYPDYAWLSYLSDLVNEKGAKNVLWGCTIDPSYVDEKMKTALDKYDLITVREHRTHESLRLKGLKSRIECVPDTAFTLQPKEWDTKQFINGDFNVGINVSNFVYDNQSFMNAVIEFIRYVLETTRANIVLIPHVFWKLQNDIATSNTIKGLFAEEERVRILDKQLNCEELKYAISKMDYYMGARTHSMIAAYSSCVPSIAFGYSIKSLGIAEDLGISNDFVINTKEELNKSILIEKFNILRESDMKKQLINIIPQIQKRVFSAENLLFRNL